MSAFADVALQHVQRGELVAAGHRAAGDQQLQRHRPADVVADTPTMVASARAPAVGVGQQRGDAARRARAQAELAQGQVADVLRMEAVHVLARIDAFDQAVASGCPAAAAGSGCRGLRVGIELIDQGQELASVVPAGRS
jgi:hypothetical protein